MAKAKKKAAKKPVKKSPAKKAVPKKKIAAKKNSAKPAAKAKAKAKKPAPKPVAKAKPVPQAAPKNSAKDFAGFLTPLDDRVLVRLKGLDRKTAGGLFIPDSVSDVSGNLQGEVVAVGRGHRSKKGRVTPMDIQPGDKIVFAEYAGSKIRVLEEDLVLLRESEVMGIIS